MPIIHEESNSSGNTSEKIVIGKIKLQNGQNERFPKAGFNDNVIQGDPRKKIMSIEKNAQISKLAESMAKMTEHAMHKVEQEKNAQISKLAESMIKVTVTTLRKIEQNESEKISKMIENMRKHIETSNDQFGSMLVNSKNYTRNIKLKENSIQPWFQ